MTRRIFAASVAAAFMSLATTIHAQGTGAGAASGGIGTGTSGTGSNAIGAPGRSTFGTAPSIGGTNSFGNPNSFDNSSTFGSSSSFGGTTSMPGVAPSPTFPSEGLSSNPSGFGNAPTPNFGTTTTQPSTTLGR